MSVDVEKCEEIFTQWVHSTVDSWLNEREAWDMELADGDVSEEELDYIQKNMSLGYVDVVNRSVSADIAKEKFEKNVMLAAKQIVAKGYASPEELRQLRNCSLYGVSLDLDQVAKGV